MIRLNLNSSTLLPSSGGRLLLFLFLLSFVNVFASVKDSTMQTGDTLETIHIFGNITITQGARIYVTGNIYNSKAKDKASLRTSAKKSLHTYKKNRAILQAKYKNSEVKPGREKAVQIVEQISTVPLNPNNSFSISSSQRFQIVLPTNLKLKVADILITFSISLLIVSLSVENTIYRDFGRDTYSERTIHARPPPFLI